MASKKGTAVARKEPEDTQLQGIVSTNDWQTGVATIVARAKVAKPEIDDDVINDYTVNNVILRDKNTRAKVEYLEREAAAVQKMYNGFNRSGIDIGRVLIDAKFRVGHGDWLYYVQSRIGMQEDKAQALMSAARAVSINPQLLPVLDNVPDSLLARIGSAKQIPDGAIDTIAAMAEEKPVPVDAGYKILRGKDPNDDVAEQQPLPFTPVDKLFASENLSAIAQHLRTITQDMDRSRVTEWAKHPEFAKWLGAVKKPKTDLDFLLSGLLVFCWQMHYSFLYGPDPVLEGVLGDDMGAGTTADSPVVLEEDSTGVLDPVEEGIPMT